MKKTSELALQIFKNSKKRIELVDDVFPKAFTSMEEYIEMEYTIMEAETPWAHQLSDWNGNTEDFYIILSDKNNFVSAERAKQLFNIMLGRIFEAPKKKMDPFVYTSEMIGLYEKTIEQIYLLHLQERLIELHKRNKEAFDKVLTHYYLDLFKV